MSRRAAPTGTAVPFREAFWFWVRLGFVNFGGPAGQIAIMHRELVERRRWIGEGAFLRGLNFCTLLPGPEAQQLAAYIGWRLHGIPGGIVAGAFFVLPSVFVLLALSWLAVAHGEVPWVSGLLYGVQPVVIAVVLAALLRIGTRTLHHPLLVAVAVLAFVAVALLRVPFPAVVLLAAACGMALQRRFPDAFRARPRGEDESSHPEPDHNDIAPSWGRALRIALVCVALWAVPVGALWLWRGPGDVLVREALFFTQAAFVTFGGAYAVLAYIAEQAVNTYRWLGPDEMAQGLGLAESTPGPLIMVTQYVGFVGAWRDAGPYPPLLNGVLGGLITTYVTFLPSFLLIFLGAPHIDALGRDRRIAGALVGVTAAVVGVI
ncbi:MAG: chromate efflux transporter, partial [Chloroflexota bacterium]|nr:chromate efflux transporter [Chloroflexota bacterium]